MLRVTLEFPDRKVKSPVQFPFKREFNKDGPLNGEADGGIAEQFAVLVDVDVTEDDKEGVEELVADG